MVFENDIRKKKMNFLFKNRIEEDIPPILYINKESFTSSAFALIENAVVHNVERNGDVTLEINCVKDAKQRGVYTIFIVIINTVPTLLKQAKIDEYLLMDSDKFLRKTQNEDKFGLSIAKKLTNDMYGTLTGHVSQLYNQSRERHSVKFSMSMRAFKQRYHYP